MKTQKTSIINTIHYTQYSEVTGCHHAQTARITRPYRLTIRGAQRILRAQGMGNEIVTGVETVIDERW